MRNRPVCTQLLLFFLRSSTKTMVLVSAHSFEQEANSANNLSDRALDHDSSLRPLHSNSNSKSPSTIKAP
ncbi:hypothetical protein Pdw03_2265 [Penicillium digitatum]|uniref:Uncharacterized protein n=1 Tax=Penicillium digitatum TaxID=36651 RepID=A0A7T6XU88_PENDI|nr:hypothetical protein Pdw03_2265 [Penicillium digitatum]